MQTNMQAHSHTIIIHCFYIVLFSALEETHCTHVVCGSKWVTCLFIAHIFNIHQSGVLFGCCRAGAMWNCCRLGSSSVYTIQPCAHTHTHTHSLRKHNKMKRTPKHPLFFLLHGKYINSKEILPEKATVKKGLWKMVLHYGSLATLTCFTYKGFNEIQIRKVTHLSSKRDWCTQSILYAGSRSFLHIVFLFLFCPPDLDTFQSRSSRPKCLKSQLLVSFISTPWPKKAKQITFICFFSP